MLGLLNGTECFKDLPFFCWPLKIPSMENLLNEPCSLESGGTLIRHDAIYVITQVWKLPRRC